MKIYSVIVTEGLDTFHAVVEEKFAGQHLKVTGTAWLLAGNGTTQEIAKRLGMRFEGQPGNNISAVITGVNGYYGWAANNIWEWISTKQSEEAP